MSNFPADRSLKPVNHTRHAYQVGPFIVDGHNHSILKSGAPIDLTPNEFEVIYQIVTRQGEIIRRDEFAPWFSDLDRNDRHPVENTIKEIRKKLGIDRHSGILETVRGRGYRVRAAVEIVDSPSLSELEKYLTIALDALKMHTSAGFRATLAVAGRLLDQRRFADASSAVALAYFNLGHTGFCRERRAPSMTKARQVTTKALEWFPGFASGLALRGLFSLVNDYKWHDAEEDFKLALKNSPKNDLAHSFFAHSLVSRGAFDEGIAHAEIAAEVAYSDAIIVMTVPWMMLFAGRADDAIIKCEKVIKDFLACAPAHMIFGDAYSAVGEYRRALEQYTQGLEIEFSPHGISCQGFVYGRLGDPERAGKCLELLREKQRDGILAYLSSWHEAVIQVGFGHTQVAIESLFRAFEERCDWLIHAAVDPHWDDLRNDAKFQQLIELIGIPFEVSQQSERRRLSSSDLNTTAPGSDSAKR